MKCKDIRLNIEPYLAGELAPEDIARVQEHLKSCVNCRGETEDMKNKIAWLRKSRDMTVKMPARLGDRLARRLASPPAKKKNPWRFAAAASIALAVILTTFYSGTIAQFVEDIPFIQKYFSFGDRGVEHSLAQGAGQVVEESKTVDGITVTVHRVIADENRTVVLYSMKAAEDAHKARFDKGILDQKGARVSGGGVFKFHEDLQKVTGRFNAPGIEKLGNSIQLLFENIHFTRQYTREISLSLDESLHIPLLDDKGTELGRYIVETAEIKENMLVIKTRWTMNETAPSNPYIVEVTQGGTRLTDARFIGGAGYATYSYHLNNMDDKDFSLILAFEKNVAFATETISMDIKIDRDLAKKNTFEKKIDQRVQLEDDVYLNFERILATASQTAIEYTVEADRERLRDFMELKIKVYSHGEEIWANHDHLDLHQGRFALRFDPTIPLENLKVVIVEKGIEITP